MLNGFLYSAISMMLLEFSLATTAPVVIAQCDEWVEIIIINCYPVWWMSWNNYNQLLSSVMNQLK